MRKRDQQRANRSIGNLSQRGGASNIYNTNPSRLAYSKDNSVSNLSQMSHSQERNRFRRKDSLDDVAKSLNNIETKFILCIFIIVNLI